MTRLQEGGKQISYSFAGCGFLGLYHVGVASCLREYAPIGKNTKILGASAGALAAMALACDLPLGESTSEILQVAIKARSRALGPFHPSFDVNKIIYDGLVKTLPDDAHIKANGRLYISVTRISDGKNVIINKFKSKDELIKAIQCSCFIPLWSGLVPPKFNGIAYIDGGCSDNLPIIDENTVTCSPFSGESDICPQDDTYNLFQVNLVNTSFALTPANLYRITRILFPAHPEVLSKMCQQGFDDALRYLQRNNRISCTRCLAIHFTLEKETEEVEHVKTEIYSRGGEKTKSKKNKAVGLLMGAGGGGKQHLHSDAHSMQNCRDCEYRRQIAVLDSLPESVVQAIQEACDEVNKGLINWIFRHRPMKLLSILSIPYLLPIDITIVLIYKIYERLPDIKRELKASLMRLVSFLRSVMLKMEVRRPFYSAKFSCEINLREFDYMSEEMAPRSRKTSNISNPRRKSSTTEPVVATGAKPAKVVEKASSFSGRKTSEYTSLFDTTGEGDNDSRSVTSQMKTESEKEQPNLQRFRKTSYSGCETSASAQDRRRSMVEIVPGVGPAATATGTPPPPERVISKHAFDFKVDNKPNSEHNLDIDLADLDQANAIEIANRALDWEQQYLAKYKPFNSEGDLKKVLEITKHQEAVMAFYYTDENNKVKMTELFNVRDEDMDKKTTTGGSDPTLAATHRKGEEEELEMEAEVEEEQKFYNDSDDGLMETTSLKSSISSATSACSGSSFPLQQSMTGSVAASSVGISPIKRQRKKSVLSYLND